MQFINHVNQVKATEMSEVSIYWYAVKGKLWNGQNNYKWGMYEITSSILYIKLLYTSSMYIWTSHMCTGFE